MQARIFFNSANGNLSINADLEINFEELNICGDFLKGYGWGETK